jgi:uncharacterized protein YcfJ
MSKMKKTFIPVAIVASIVASSAVAEMVEVPISAVTPNYSSMETRVPVQSCNKQLVPVNNNGSRIPFRNNGVAQLPELSVGNLLGGAVGGLLGNQFGGGKGKMAMTGAGAVVGWALGGNINKTPNRYQQHRYQQQTVCTTSYRIEHKQFISSYTVHYDFNGVRYRTRTIIPPRSNTLKLMINTSHTVQK